MAMELLNNNPTVWKVSLEGCGENPTRTDCMNNGYIRIGWPEYGVVDDFSEKDDFPTGGKVILRAFQNAMNIGDLVLSCYSNTEIDAIGIITGDYEVSFYIHHRRNQPWRNLEDIWRTLLFC